VRIFTKIRKALRQAKPVSPVPGHELSDVNKRLDLYHIMENNLTDVIWIVEIATLKYILVSQSIEKIFGYTPEEAYTMLVTDLVAHDELQRLLDILKTELEAEKHGTADPERVYVIETVLIHKTGTRIPVDVRVKFIRDAMGKPYALQGISRDISSLKQAQRALQESESLYKLITENVTDIIWIFDLAEMKTVYISPSVETIRGMSVEEAKALSLEAKFPPESMHRLLKKIQDEFEKDIKGEREADRTVCMELQAYKKNGTTIWLEMTIKFLRDHQGNPVALQGISRDITDRKRMERVLQYRLELDNLITAISTHFINISSAGFDDAIEQALHIIGDFVNADRSYVLLFDRDGQKIEKIYEWCRVGELCQKGMLENARIENIPWLTAKLHEFSSINIFSNNEIFRTDEGEKAGTRPGHDTDFICTPMIYAGSLKGVLGFDRISRPESWSDDFLLFIRIISDILVNAFEHIQSEKRLLRAKEEAEKANMAKSQLLTNMSHELRTPLNSILGFSQLLQMESVGHLNQEQKEFLAYINNSGEHLLEMVNDLLDLSKIEAGRLELRKRYFDLRKLLSEFPRKIGVLLEQKELKMELSIGEGIDIIYADPVRIKQILYNLISNAIKFTDSGKNIGISARRKNEDIEIVVWDQGIGIAEENQERIFQYFEQLHMGLHEGTGLGLAISKELIELHGGRVKVDSAPDKGSSFTIRLPVAVSPGNVSDQPQDEMYAGDDTYCIRELSGEMQKCLALVVEDNRVNMKLIKAILENRGIQVISAGNGEEGVEKTRNEKPDLILMDIHLPGIDGIETMKRIREMDGGVPIIALTADAMKGSMDYYLEKGFNDYISKPIQVDEIIGKIRKLMEGGQNNNSITN
jgi:PAS domain S-box-containing protein